MIDHFDPHPIYSALAQECAAVAELELGGQEGVADGPDQPSRHSRSADSG
jgi:hypothetical protein